MEANAVVAVVAVAAFLIVGSALVVGGGSDGHDNHLPHH